MVSVIDPLLFVIYTNDLPDRIMPICKIFDDNKSLLSKIVDTKNSQNIVKSDLRCVSNWAYQ